MMNMNSQYIPLYKTIILYLLKSSETPLSKAQIMDFMLESAYTSFLVLQEVFSELVEQRLVREEEDASRTYLFITRVGEDTLEALKDGIREDILLQADKFLEENKHRIRNEASLRSSYHGLSSGSYEVHLEVNERGRSIFEIFIEVPSKEAAVKACDEWEKISGDLYQYTIKKLLL